MKFIKNPKILLIIIFLFLFSSLAFVFGAESKNRSYYLGDAINYHGQVIFGSANMGNFEMFKLENNKIIKTSSIKSTEARFFGNDSFYDSLFNEEEGRLYVYLVDGRCLYKYDVSDLYHPLLERKIKDNSWDWFMGLDKFSDKIATIGTKEVKIWNQNLKNIDAFKVKNQFHNNISFNRSGRIIFNVVGNKIEIFDTQLRKVVSELPIYSKVDHFRKIYFNDSSRKLYVVDDQALKQFSLDENYRYIGVNGYSHISDYGYDVQGISDEPYIYFSDGLGVVKVSRQGLNSLDWVYTTSLGAPGGWAMGLKVVKDGAGEKIIVFNNSEILVLDKNLDMISYYQSSKENSGPFESLYLLTNKDEGRPGEVIRLSGGGFLANENLLIYFAGVKFNSQTDGEGKFEEFLEIPEADPQNYSIKVTGDDSSLTYSRSFIIN